MTVPNPTIPFRALRLVLPALALILAQGCAQQWQKTELYFGLSRPDGSVIDPGEWAVFLAREVTPRFPDGLTVVEADGQWQTDGGPITREPARVLILIYPPHTDAGRRIDDIRQAYLRQFDQTSVLRVDQRVKADF